MFITTQAHRRRIGSAALILLCALLALCAMPARADKRDHDLARQALQAGTVLPLRAILDIVEARYPGQIMEVEFDHDDGEFEYELKVLQADGRLIKLKLDARNGQVLKASSKRDKSRRR